MYRFIGRSALGEERGGRWGWTAWEERAQLLVVHSETKKGNEKCVFSQLVFDAGNPRENPPYEQGDVTGLREWNSCLWNLWEKLFSKVKTLSKTRSWESWVQATAHVWVEQNGTQWNISVVRNPQPSFTPAAFVLLSFSSSSSSPCSCSLSLLFNSDNSP